MRSLSLLVCLSAACFSAYSYSSDLTDLRGDPAAIEHNISDDGYAQVPLDFEFPFYGRTFTHSWMFSNGVIGFLGPTSSFCCTGYDIPTRGPEINFTLMPLQTDLRNYNGQFLTKGDEDSMTYGWYDISEYGRPDSSNTFEAEIFADGMYEFRYGDLDVARSVTIASVGDIGLDEYQVHHFGVLPPNGIETITDYNLGGVCQVDPLYDPNCPGYAEAFARVQYEQNCFADPLYDAGCPGYAEALFAYECTADPLYDQGCPGYVEAFYDFQCEENSLYDQGCPGYTEAFYDLQCEQNPLYDSGCPGYAEAFYDLQCEQNSLYDSGCPGYAQAFFLEQCSINPLYDSACDGYADAFLEQQCNRDPLYSASCAGYADAMDEQKQSGSSTAATSSSSVESLIEPSVTGDATIDEVLRGASKPIEIAVIPVAPPTPTPETERDQEQESEQEQADDPKDSRRAKLREIAIDEAKNLANTMSAATSIEQQQAMQARVMSLISYVPGFSAYSTVGVPQPSVYYEPRDIYETLAVPDSNRGARVGLAQELLHTRMVDMQYNRED